MDGQITRSLSDIKVLLDFLQAGCSSESNHEAQITSLQTLSGMCSEKVVDILIKVKGLDVIWELCGKTENPDVCQTCLYVLACAVEISNDAKEYLTRKQVFSNIRAILKSDVVPEKTKLCSIYFLLPLLSENELGQELILATGCLHILLHIYIERVKLITGRKHTLDNHSYELWLLSSKALKQSLALPQNKANQQQCARYIPHMVTILHESKGEGKVIMHSCQVFSAVIANNAHCQEIAFNARAIEVFILLLQSWINEHEKTEIAGNIVTGLSMLIGDNELYRQRFQKLGGVATLLSLVNSGSGHASSLGVCHLNQALTILANCAKTSRKCRRLLSDGNTASAIVRLMNEVDGDEYFSKVAANLLHFCVEKSLSDDCSESSSQATVLSNHSKSSQCEDQEDGILHVPQDEQAMYENKVDHLLRFQHDSVAESIPMNAAEPNDRVMDILERQQEQIDLLQKLLIEERNLRLKKEERPAPQNNQSASQEKPTIQLKESSQASTGSEHWWENPVLPLNTSKSTQTPERERQHFQIESLLLPETPMMKNDTERKCFRRSGSVNVRKDKPLLVETNQVDCSLKKPKFSKPVDDAAPNAPRQPTEDVAIIHASNSKYYIQSKKSIRQHYLQDNSTLRPKLSLLERFNDAQRQDQDDIVTICSDILDEEVKKSKMRCFRRKGKTDKKRDKITNQGQKNWKEQLNTYSKSDIYSPKLQVFKRPIPPHDRRRSRIKFEAAEERNLRNGVRVLGKNFRDILYGFQFHPRRSATDLRDKYRNMSRKTCGSVA